MAVKAGHSERIKKHVLAFEMKGLGEKKILPVSWTTR